MKILGKAEATAEQMANYLLSVNPEPKINMDVVAFCRLFLYMGAVEGVRGDALFAQSCKETGNFNFRGTVKEDQNNYAGLGTTDTSTPGATFPDEATGILAQAQHTKGYATKDALNFAVVDPRYNLLVQYGKQGIAPEWEDLGGSWAVPGYDTKKYTSLEEAKEAGDSYGHQIIDILEKILGKSVEVEAEEETEAETEDEGKDESTVKPKVCLDAGHYGKYNRSPGVPEYYESETVWKLTELQKKYLEQMGIEVITTRANQAKDLELKERGMASEGCDLFLSNHTNAVGGGMNEGIDHVAVYHLVDDTTTTVDDISEEFAKGIAPIIADVMGVEDGFKILTRKSSNDRNDDGIMNDNYYGVLNGARQAGTPGLILEHSFHTNTRMVQWLLNDNNLDKLAKAEAEYIAEFLLGKKVELGQEEVKQEETKAEQVSKFPYKVKIMASSLNVRAGAGTNYKVNTTVSRGEVYTIVAEDGIWGKLKSGAGWISLKYTERL